MGFGLGMANENFEYGERVTLIDGQYFCRY